MKRISFDGGKTFIDLIDDPTGDLYVVIQKMRSRKNWDKLVELLEPEAMTTAINNLKVNKYLNLNNAESRVLFLGEYLRHAKEDIVTKM